MVWEAASIERSGSGKLSNKVKFLKDMDFTSCSDAAFTTTVAPATSAGLTVISAVIELLFLLLLVMYS